MPACVLMTVYLRVVQKYQHAFLLLFRSLGAASASASASAGGAAPSLLTCAAMWSTLLQACIDLGERVRVHPKIRNKVASLIPTTVSSREHT